LAGVLWDEAELALSPVPDTFGWKRDIILVKSMQWRQPLKPYIG
jgi:hypothetical protein